MFDIEYKGGNTVVISTKKSTLVVDPKQSVVGLKDLAVNGAIELATEARFALNSADAHIALEGPGEYEVADFSIKGIASQRHIDTLEVPMGTALYRVGVADINIAILGNISPELSEDELEALNVIDILILPVGGGGYTLDATSAAAIVRQVSPKAVIPVHYADNSLTYEVPQDDLELFISELGVEVEDVGTKYKIKTASSLPQTLSIVKLSRI